MQTTTGCNLMWPDHFLSAQTMAYVSFSLAVKVRRWPSARIRLQNATDTCDPSSKKKCFSIALRHTLVVLEMH